MDGVILCDKPAGVTSHDVVAQVRRVLGRGQKVGHSGTLDPFATGLLLVLVGRATRAQRFLMELPKSYRVLARLGAVSSTGDPEGDVVETGVLPPADLALPVGELRQRPPAYSAIKVGGERLYLKARRGEVVEAPERTVVVRRFELLWRAGERAEFAIDCSSGTYVRSLIAALGDAYCLDLRRTSIGSFQVADAAPPPECRADAQIVPIADALDFLPERRLEQQEARRAAHGVAVAGQATGVVRLTDAHGLVALAEPRHGSDGATLKPVVGFRG